MGGRRGLCGCGVHRLFAGPAAGVTPDCKLPAGPGLFPGVLDEPTQSPEESGSVRMLIRGRVGRPPCGHVVTGVRLRGVSPGMRCPVRSRGCDEAEEMSRVVTVMADSRMPARPGRSRSERPVGSQPYARLLQQQAAIGWGSRPAGRRSGYRRPVRSWTRSRTVEDLVIDRIDRVADLVNGRAPGRGRGCGGGAFRRGLGRLVGVDWAAAPDAGHRAGS